MVVKSKKKFIRAIVLIIGIAIGINPLTILTSGILGFPGLIMLYGINLYKIL